MALILLGLIILTYMINRFTLAYGYLNLNYKMNINKTLAEIGSVEKPTITSFYKMDLFEEFVFDKWLDENLNLEILKETMP